MQTEDIKNQFTILRNNPDIAYLDNASSTQTVDRVLDAMNEYYTEYRANIHRGLYSFSDTATQKYEEARAKVAEFLEAQSEEIVFTAGVTDALNMLAHSLCQNLTGNDNIVLTQMEHHSNLVPWLEMQKKYGFGIRYIPIHVEGEHAYELDMSAVETLIDKHTKIVSVTAISNTLGTENDIKKIIELSKKQNATTIIDAAQAVAHEKISATYLGCDFLVFSGHKMHGPTGIGVLFGKKELLEELKPARYGGGMITEVSFEEARFASGPAKFEAGTPHIAGAIGLGAAVDFVQSIGWDCINTHEQELTAYALDVLKEEVNIVGSLKTDGRAGVISFNVDGVHPHDVADILDKHGVAVRAGHHCTMPLMKLLGLTGTVRASIGMYNTKEDIDHLVHALQKVKKVFET